MSNDKIDTRNRRKRRIRQKVSGTAERPRLTVFRSSKHIYAQVIDDASSSSLAVVSTLSKSLADELKDKSKQEEAKVVGAAIAKACQDKGITRVVFDRNGYAYHGRVSALADAAREAGLEF
ncbi:50S ribosomal protein L18 [Paraliomyxa miuraensis]|uniref:50S ribosomal protein L18 n=1 Tax=Paraliomyxa miuraensis TaxID=376150 RepID=UPI002259068F|nr:50S ribosomal protein L18 [Paraliomyxa miuraensis]MCX4241292.1 50S ribosomal protein L18 [Paraliomyxa miuraensis]